MLVWNLRFSCFYLLNARITGVCHDAQESNPGLMNAKKATHQLNYTPCPLGLPVCFGDGSYYAAQARFEFIMHPITSLDLRSSSLYLPNAGITGMCPHALRLPTSFLTEARHASQTHSCANPATTVQGMASMLQWAKTAMWPIPLRASFHRDSSVQGAA